MNYEEWMIGGLILMQPVMVEILKKEEEIVRAAERKAAQKKLKKREERVAGKAAKGKAIAEYKEREVTLIEITPSSKYMKRGILDEIQMKKEVLSAHGASELEGIRFILGLVSIEVSSTMEFPF
ncbi:hypothetical protein HOY82DRAFT_616464 [Tuber indicum]|nr:hypothetical protein HOY82DRAFT_616464 [Tuber indicum]